MKKTVCIFLSLLLALCVFAGCDSSANNADSQNKLETFGGQSAEETTPSPQTTQAAATASAATPSPTVTMPAIEGEDTEDTTASDNSGNGRLNEHDTNDAKTSTSPSGTQTSSTPRTSTTPRTTSVPSTTTTPASPSSTPDTGTMDGTYKSILNQIRDEGTLPDGTSASGGSVQYAEADVNGDGSTELIIRVSGSKELVCRYNGAGGVTVVGTLSPGTTYYSNGAATAGGDSAYTVYNYDSDSGRYSQIATVEQWVKSSGASDGDGEGESEDGDDDDSFPDGIDANGDGIVYIINGGEGREIVDNSEYDSWRSAVLGTAVSVGFQGI